MREGTKIEIVCNVALAPAVAWYLYHSIRKQKASQSVQDNSQEFVEPAKLVQPVQPVQPVQHLPPTQHTAELQVSMITTQVKQLAQQLGEALTQKLIQLDNVQVTGDIRLLRKAEIIRVIALCDQMEVIHS